MVNVHVQVSSDHWVTCSGQVACLSGGCNALRIQQLHQLHVHADIIVLAGHMMTDASAIRQRLTGKRSCQS